MPRCILTSDEESLSADDPAKELATSNKKTRNDKKDDKKTKKDKKDAKESKQKR